MTDAAARFDLLNEPWIPVRTVGGRTHEASIRDVFSNAREIREIGGELPTQTFAITRLLLAILYRAADGPVDEELWVEWWRDGLPADGLDDYLDRFGDRFDLFHAERPFFQVAGLRTRSDEVKDVSPLILDLPSNNRLFTNRAAEGAARLSFAEAARWLVNTQAFDPSGIKSGAVGDPRVKGGKGYPIGLAWSGLLGGIMHEGDTLHETLLLNLAGESAYLRRDLERDIPPWEEEEPDDAAPRPALHPSGPVRLYTWQSRRIRLISDGSTVTGCVLANGDALTPQNMHHLEAMTAWRYSEPQSKKAGSPTYMPREHLPDRAFWRGISALLPATVSVDAKGIERTQAPASVQWIARLQSRGVLDSGKRVRLRAIGVIYGSNNSVVDEVIDDRLQVSFALLSEQNEALAAEAENAVRLADNGVRALRRLAEDLARAAGGEGDGERARAEESAYAALDGAYRGWLATLDDRKEPASVIAEWRTTARTIIRRLGDQLVASAGPSAWVGREIRVGNSTELINTPRAESWFRLALNNAFGDTIGKDVAA